MINIKNILNLLILVLHLCFTTQATEDSEPKQEWIIFLSNRNSHPPAVSFLVKPEDYPKIPTEYLDGLKAIPKFQSLCQAIYRVQDREFIFVEFDDTWFWPASWNNDKKQITISRAFMATIDGYLRDIDTIESLIFEACNAANPYMPIILDQNYDPFTNADVSSFLTEYTEFHTMSTFTPIFWQFIHSLQTTHSKLVEKIFRSELKDVMGSIRHRDGTHISCKDIFSNEVLQEPEPFWDHWQAVNEYSWITGISHADSYRNKFIKYCREKGLPIQQKRPTILDERMWRIIIPAFSIKSLVLWLRETPLLKPERPHATQPHLLCDAP